MTKPKESKYVTKNRIWQWEKHFKRQE